MDARVALITGANRGLGQEVSRQLAERGYTVVVTARNGDAAAAAAAEIGEHAHPCELDVTDRGTILRAATFVADELGRLDVLVNNAAVYHDDDASVLKVSHDNMRETIEVNLLGPVWVCQAMVPLMRHGTGGRIVNVSSGGGQLHDMGSGWPGYRMSKAALNALTRILATELRGDGILVNSVCPGWVRTDMGGPDADRSIAEGAAGIVWAATLADDGPTGGFFRDGQALDW